MNCGVCALHTTLKRGGSRVLNVIAMLLALFQTGQQLKEPIDVVPLHEIGQSLTHLDTRFVI